MSMSIRVSPVVSELGAAAGPLPRPGSLPAQVQVVEDRYFTAAATAPAGPRIVSSQELVQRTGHDFVLTMSDGPGITPALLSCMDRACQLWGLRTGAVPELVAPGQPANADTLLMPAVIAVRRSEQLLRSKVPNAFKDEDLQAVDQAREQVEGAEAILRILAPLIYALTAMKQQGQQYLDGFSRRVYRRAAPEMEGDFLLSRDLNDLRKHVTWSSEEGTKTKALKQDVAAETEAATLARVEKALASQTPASPPAAAGPAAFSPTPPTPAAPPVPRLPEPIYQKPGQRALAPRKRSR